MPHRTLADFLEELGRAGELAPVDAEVDPCLEVAEITRRVARQAGPALLFRSVKGHDIPLLTNLLGTEPRICRALGVETIEEATGRMDRRAEFQRQRRLAGTASLRFPEAVPWRVLPPIA